MTKTIAPTGELRESNDLKLAGRILCGNSQEKKEFDEWDSDRICSYIKREKGGDWVIQCVNPEVWGEIIVNHQLTLAIGIQARCASQPLRR